MKTLHSTPQLAVVCMLLVLFAIRGHAQLSVAPISIDIQGFVEPGYYVAAPLQQDTLVVVDEYARPLLHTRVGLHTNVVGYKGRYVTHFGGARRSRYFVRRDASLRAIDTFAISPPAVTDFHEGKVWTDTSMILLGFEEVTMDVSALVPGGKADATVLVGVIEEQTFDGRVVFRWRSIDHIALTEATSDIDLTQNYIDYIHINSIWRDTNGDLLVSCRHTDQVIRIDRTTGSVVWRLGGSEAKRNDFRFLNDTIGGFVGFSHQHTAFRTPRGTLMLFDNGNLKPEPRLSRVVEYEIDEVARTVRAIRSVIPDSIGFVRSMGNVEELPGGNIVVGYGNESGRILAHEIDRNDRIVATIRNTEGFPIDPYRVIKSRIGMVARLDTLDTRGRYAFSDADSATGLALFVIRASSPVVVSAERHHTRPPVLQFTDPEPMHVLPMRWVLRFSAGDPRAVLTATSEFDLGVLPGSPVDAVCLYSRDSVGVGPFRPVKGPYDKGNNTITYPDIIRGEVIAALDSLPAPVRVSNASEPELHSSEAALVVLRMPAAGVDAIVSAWPEDDPSEVISRTVRQRPDGTVVLLLEGLKPDCSYRWTAASVGSAGIPSEAISWSTRTLPLIDERIEATSPSSDTLVVGDSVVLSWVPVRAGDRTLLQFTSSMRGPLNGVDFSLVPLDTIPEGQERVSLAKISGGMSYFWRVLQADSVSSGRWSRIMGFATPPESDQGLLPLSPPNGSIHPASPVRLTYTTSERFQRYAVQITEVRRDGSVADPVTIQPDASAEATFDDPRDGSIYFWRVIGSGSDADTGCVFLFSVQQASSVPHLESERHYVTCKDGALQVIAAGTISGLAVIDVLGRMHSVNVGQGVSAVHSPLPLSGLAWCGVIVRDGYGRISVHSLICR